MFSYVPFRRRNIRLGIFVTTFVIIILVVWQKPLLIQKLITLFQYNYNPITTVPNTVHFFHFVDKENPTDNKNYNAKEVQDLNFISATCILAAAFNQEPDRLIIHTNTNITFNLANKKYWSLIFRVLGPKRNNHQKKKDERKLKIKTKPKTILNVAYLKQPTHVFGQPLSSTFHAADVARLNLLIREGGIALDQDTFIVRKLDPSFFNQGTKVTLGKILFCYMSRTKYLLDSFIAIVQNILIVNIFVIIVCKSF